ncbi:LCP family protein [Streptomyces tirandamycinicus]|uniref:LCP family protein n=1 Tax=Streptomyces tirandamycinicus TaxID=2174846 RepID=UPI003F4D9D33
MADRRTPEARPARGPVRPARHGRKVPRAVSVLAALLTVVTAAGVWAYRDLQGNIRSADVDGRIGDDRPPRMSPGSKNILVVGSDSRAGANAEYGRGHTTMHSDTLMVLHLAADREWATVVSFPRDSWVEVPACDRGDGTTSGPHHAKINEAFAIGGTGGEVARAAACAIKTVERNTGLRIDHFMSVDFQGFKGMVNALDGMTVCPTEAIRDERARLDIPAGCQTVRDEDALGYVRARYGVGDGSDLGRIGRQQEFLRALADRAQEKLTSPGAMYGLLESATKSLTTDEALAGIQPLYGLASRLKAIPPGRLTFVTVPNYPRSMDVPSDTANVVWQYPEAAELFTSLARDREVSEEAVAAAGENPLYAGTVRVRVLDGTGTPGLAEEVAGSLRRYGFTIAGTGTAPTAGVGAGTGAGTGTSVTHPAGLARQARALASRLPGAGVAESADAPEGLVTLTLGEGFGGTR